MTVLLWILAVLAVPTLIFVVWIAGVFLKEFFNPSPDDGTEAAQAAEKLGLLPAERQGMDYPAQLPADWAAALDAVRRADWEPAAEVLRTIGRDWERRTTLIGHLATLAAKDDEWLLAWEAARPEDPDAAVVRAQSTVYLAWELRGAKKAKYTTQEQFQGFHRTLVGAREEIARAAALNPEDPTPHVAEIWVALGLGYANAEMDKLWAEIKTRAPHHFGAHFSALQYWCAKWRGSQQLAFDFAERAAAEAPLGSLLTALPLIAHFEHDESTDTEADNTPEMVARVDAGLADAAAADPTHPGLAQLRHLLAFYLHLQDRHEAALEQFKLVDGHVEALPWSYRGDGAAAYYCQVRNDTVRAVTAEA
ncbi:hypothetical protein [Streptomyces sp. NPDC048710]|uniref:hypothetical protein n=1 Tax=unclassified Streptomyces TaxID=2593676 RepID=UPI0037160AC1